MTGSNPLRKIGVLMHAGQEHTRLVSLGAIQYAQANAQIQFAGDGFNALIPWDRIGDWKGDGLIAIVNGREQLECLRKFKKPVVLAGSRIVESDFSMVSSDNWAIGEMAAVHLAECGFQRMVFFGQCLWDDEQKRLEGFRDRVEQDAGSSFYRFDVPVEEILSPEQIPQYSTNLNKLVAQLKTVETPFGVFCPNSVLARGIIEACHVAGLNVPDEVGVIGVNDEALDCETTVPPLSTVVQQSRQIGFKACELLCNLLFENPTTSHIAIPPQGVLARRSTDVLLVEDEVVSQALQIIREKACRGIDVDDVVSRLGISRRSLEIRFQKNLNRSPLTELNRVRIERAKQLLLASDQSVTNVALECGFGSSQSFSAAFRKSCGKTPSEFRNLQRELYG